MNDNPNIDSTLRQLIENETVTTNETIWWIGRPSPFALAKSQFSLSSILGGFIFLSFQLVMLNQILTVNPHFLEPKSGLFPYFFLTIFALAALASMQGIIIPIWALIEARFIVYAITNQRTIILSRFPKPSWQSCPPSQFEMITRSGSAKKGNVTFAKQPVAGFFGIRDPYEVEALLMKLAKSAER